MLTAPVIDLTAYRRLRRYKVLQLVKDEVLKAYSESSQPLDIEALLPILPNHVKYRGDEVEQAVRELEADLWLEPVGNGWQVGPRLRGLG